MKFIWIIPAILMVAACDDDKTKSGNSGTDSDSNSDSATVSGTDSISDTSSTGITDSDSSSSTDSTTINDSDSGSDIDQCVDLDWEVALKSVNILVLLDRSGSMLSWKMPAGTGDSYASVVEQAVNYIVEQNTAAGTVNFALNAFPDAQSCISQTDTDKDQCAPASNFVSTSDGTDPAAAPLVDFYRDTDSELMVSTTTPTLIQSTLGTIGQCGGTPISKSLAWAASYLAEQQLPPQDTYVILATDGAPNCNAPAASDSDSNLDPETCETTDGSIAVSPLQCLDDVASYNQAKALRAAGYKMFVIGVNDPNQASVDTDSSSQPDPAMFKDVMNGLAYYGAAATPEASVPPLTTGTYYYAAETPETLDAALEHITNEVIDCEYEVDWLAVPDTFMDADSDTLPVNKNCSDVRLFGVAAADSTEEEVGYTENCDLIAPGSLAWNWVESPGTTLDVLKTFNADYTKCTTIRLCPGTCDKLKSQSSQAREWSQVSAKFGCEPKEIPIVVE
ncbi:MAG: hypothetical protein JXR76_30585 [Deltaproteobacteria bacterium]|nr:hypothetical protein [Deltaproteobacteria bacterium]